jgi:DNA repair exonuclease SbcCD ATPase subunit
MRIRRIRMTNFRRFEDYEVELDPGLNLILGSNESGKSTIVKALSAALFADPASKSRVVREFARWGTEAATRLELDLDHRGSSYTLTKDFGAGRVELANHSTGEVIGDRSRVDDLVRTMVGFGTPDAFESVAAVRQGELDVLREEKSRRGELVPMIERKMTSSSGVVDAASVLDRIDKEIARLRVGLDHPAKNPGPLRALEDERARLVQRVGELKASWAAVVRTIGELSQERERLEKSTIEHERLDRAVRGEERRQAVDIRLAEVRKGLDNRESRIGKIRKLRKDIEEAWDRLGVTTYGQEKRAVANAKADLDSADRRVRDLADSAPAWSGEGADRRAAAVTGAVAVVAFVLLLSPAIGWFSSYRLLLVLTGAALTAVAAALFRRTLRIWAFARDLRLAMRERQRLSTVLMAALSRLGFPNYAEFEHAAEAYDRAQKDADTARAVLTDICGSDDPAVVEETLEREAAGLGRERRELEAELQELGGAPPVAPSELLKLRAERDRLQEEIRLLSEKISRHEWEVGRKEAEDSLPDLESRLEMIESDRLAYERKLRVLALAREGLASALATTKEEAASALEPIVEQVLSRVTLGRYDDVSVGRDLGLSVKNPESKGGPARIDPDQLSTGTVDQLYLAIRFALLEFLSSRDGAPFILDEGLVNTDPDRRLAALKLLHEVSSERQVIILSCESHGSEFADAVIELPGVHGLTWARSGRSEAAA